MTKRHPTTWILVCDGARGRIFAQAAPHTDLTVVAAAEHRESHGHARDLGSDKPGRSHDSTHTGARHAMAPHTDLHMHEKTVFAREMAATLESAAMESAFDNLVVVAPPRVLGDLRQALGAHAKERLVGELDKDLTHLDAPDLYAHLGSWISPPPRL